MHSFLVLLVVGLWLGSALLVLAVARFPRDLVLRYFALVIILLAMQQTWVIDEYSTTSFARLATNVLGLCAAFGKVCFFRTALRPKGAPRPRLGPESLVVLAVAAADVVAIILAPPAVRPAIGQPRNGYLLQAFVFEVVTTGYLASVSCRVIYWTRKLIARVDNRLHRASLALVGLASVASLAAGVLDLAVHCVAFAAPSLTSVVQPYYVYIYFPVAIGFFVFFIGAMLPVFVEAFWSIPAAALQLAEFRVMGPLWSALHKEFPRTNLRKQWGIHRLFYRRGVEIRDGLVLLKDYYDSDVAAEAGRVSRSLGEDSAVRSITVGVALVREALAAHRDGRLSVRPHPVPTSGAQDWATDTAWIVWLARAYASSNPSVPPPSLLSLAQPR
jgi:hypothetical protein